MQIGPFKRGNELQAGLLGALFHAAGVGYLINEFYDSYFAGHRDFLLHRLPWVLVDFPIAVALTPLLPWLGMPNGESDRIWTAAVTDVMFLISGTALWFVYGFFIIRLFTHGYLSGLSRRLKARRWWTIRAAGRLVLIATLLYLVRYEVLRRTPLREYLVELSLAEGFVLLMFPMRLTLLTVGLESRRTYRKRQNGGGNM